MRKISKNIKTVTIITLSVFVVVLGVRVSSQNQRIKNYEKDNEDLSILLNGPKKIRGYSCGVLSESKAKELLSSDSVQARFLTSPSSKVQELTPTLNNLFWADNCRYEDKFDNSKYIELYINTFQSSEDSKNAFPDFSRIVNDSDEIDSGIFGEKLVYDGGSYTLLKSNQVIQVSANNGNSNITEFSRTVFKELMEAIN